MNFINYYPICSLPLHSYSTAKEPTNNSLNSHNLMAHANEQEFHNYSRLEIANFVPRKLMLLHVEVLPMYLIPCIYAHCHAIALLKHNWERNF
jgi:hypothetical protein